MAQINTQSMAQQGPVIPVAPQPNVYTAMILVAALVLAIALGVVIYDMSANYGLSFGELLTGAKSLPGK